MILERLSPNSFGQYVYTLYHFTCRTGALYVPSIVIFQYHRCRKANMSWCFYHPGQCSNAQYGGYSGGFGGNGGSNSGSSSSSGQFGDGNGGFNSISSFFGFDIQKAEAIRLAHGVIACLAFVIFFPLGAIFMRILPGRLSIIMHALFQLFAYVLYIIAFALGCWMASTLKFGGRFNFVSTSLGHN